MAVVHVRQKVLFEEFISTLGKPDRQALHATMLRLYHPVTGIEMEWHAPLPQDMVELIEQCVPILKNIRIELTGYDQTDCPGVANIGRRGSL